jgi:hypothetical protein
MAEPKKVNYKLIEDKSIHSLLEEIVSEYHEDLADAHIALAWQKSIKADKDGRLVLGKCVKATDLQKEFMPYDFVILLNEDVWRDPQFTNREEEGPARPRTVPRGAGAGCRDGRAEGRRARPVGMAHPEARH